MDEDEGAKTHEEFSVAIPSQDMCVAKRTRGRTCARGRTKGDTKQVRRMAYTPYDIWSRGGRKEKKTDHTFFFVIDNPSQFHVFMSF